MNLPNTITIIRLLLIPVFLLLWWTEYYLSATAVFFIASATDVLDGHLARSRNQETKLGALLDPLVDKILVTTGLIMLVEMQIKPEWANIPGWAVVLMLTREFLVTGLRTILVDRGIVLGAGTLGKLKTFLQISAITIIYLSLSLEQHHNPNFETVLLVGYIIFWLAFVITLASGVQYAIRGKRLLESKDPKHIHKTSDNVIKSSTASVQEEEETVLNL
ncbi:MAG: CDP-diacylglycerol--glycerol-3-phosphate 3-phosphatidyltransferase [Cyanobacteriota bacterium]